jgi:hypothetical protein
MAMHTKLTINSIQIIVKKDRFFFSFAIVAALFIASIMTTIITDSHWIKNAYAVDDNNWFLGKGAKPNMYVTYRISEHDTNEGQPFEMTIWFKQQDKDGNWIAPVFVVDQGKVISSTFKLSALDLTALSTSAIPKELSPYRNAYANSLQWLAAFVPKPGQSLSAAYWGKIAAIGGSAIAPSGTAKVTVPAGTFDTKVITWHKGVDNHIWINKDLPYPVKAQTFADVTTGIAPIQYTFDLLAIGQGQPTTPKTQIQIPNPPLTLQTARGTYYIKLYWEPKSIETGKDTKFGILFMDNSKSIIKDVSYSFVVTDSNGTVLKDVKDQKATNGNGTQIIKFDKGGPVDVLISVDAVAGGTSGDFVENSKFRLIVTPPLIQNSTQRNSGNWSSESHQISKA